MIHDKLFHHLHSPYLQQPTSFYHHCILLFQLLLTMLTRFANHHLRIMYHVTVTGPLTQKRHTFNDVRLAVTDPQRTLLTPINGNHKTFYLIHLSTAAKDDSVCGCSLPSTCCRA